MYKLRFSFLKILKRKLLQWLVSQQTEKLDLKVKCKMILEVRLNMSKYKYKYLENLKI